MARHYSTREFFRQMPNRLLARLFEERGVLSQLDFSAMKDTQPEELFLAWLNLPVGQHKGMDTDFREIFEMSCEKGFRAILDEAEWQMRGDPDAHLVIVEKLSALANHFERAMVTFLDHRELWKGACHFYHADSLSHWRKRKNLPHVPAALDHESRAEFAQAIRTYFHQIEGRGKNCIVEVFRRGALDYFFAYPEDYSQQSVEWVEDEFKRRPHNPAFEVIFVYAEEKGTLDVNYRGEKKSIEPLQAMFAQTILKLPELPSDPDDERVYDLSPLMRRDFGFVYDSRSGIQQVAVKKLRLSARFKKGDRITVEADSSQNVGLIYDLVEKIARSVSLDMYNVTQAEISAKVLVEDRKPPKLVTIRITYPNSCSLKYDETDLKLRAMLEESGIEPKSPQGEIVPDQIEVEAQR